MIEGQLRILLYSYWSWTLTIYICIPFFCFIFFSSIWLLQWPLPHARLLLRPTKETETTLKTNILILTLLFLLLLPWLWLWWRGLRNSYCASMGWRTLWKNWIAKLTDWKQVSGISAQKFAAINPVIASLILLISPNLMTPKTLSLMSSERLQLLYILMYIFFCVKVDDMADSGCRKKKTDILYTGPYLLTGVKYTINKLIYFTPVHIYCPM